MLYRFGFPESGVTLTAPMYISLSHQKCVDIAIKDEGGFLCVWCICLKKVTLKPDLATHNHSLAIGCVLLMGIRSENQNE